MTEVNPLEGLGRALSLLRKRAGLTQIDVQKRAGFAASTVSDWEREIAAPQLDNLSAFLGAVGSDLRALCDALDEVNARGRVARLGKPNARLVASLATSQRFDESSLYGMAMALVDPSSPSSAEDFIASVELAAGEVARKVVAQIARVAD